MSLGYINNPKRFEGDQQPPVATAIEVEIEEEFAAPACVTVRGPALSLLRSALIGIPFLLFMASQKAVGFSLYLVPLLVFTANCPCCWYAMTVAAYTGSSVLLLDRLYEDTARYTVFMIIVAVHLLPFYLVSWKRLLTFLAVVGGCVQTTAWLVIGEPAGVDVVYAALPVFVSFGLQVIIFFDMVYLKRSDIAYLQMLYRVCICDSPVTVGPFDL